MLKKTSLISEGISLLFILALAGAFSASVANALNPVHPAELTDSQKNSLSIKLDELYPERTALLTSLPYSTTAAKLNIAAESAIIIDTETGSILYEKNADKEIPPASMTKLVEMYVVLEACENGKISLDDVVPLPPQSWSVNLPSDASRMFLGEGQIVTLKELLLGLSIASGNDASIAVASYVCGSMDSFVEQMNSVISSLGLTHTHFVESSGYSELNVTTAREFAAFSRSYIKRFPYALKEFHSQKMISYPEKKNLPEWQRDSEEISPVVQYNTNKLLGKLPGCDGLKTGFINESGYNLALTAVRYGNRFLSVTMGGPGNGTLEGNKYRNADGTELMEYAFSTFADYHAPENRKHIFAVSVEGSREKTVNLIPAMNEPFTVPFIAGGSPGGAAASVTARAYIPSVMYGDIMAGDKCGTITYSIGDTVLRTLPLVCDRDTGKGNIFECLWGKAVYETVRVLRPY